MSTELQLHSWGRRFELITALIFAWQITGILKCDIIILQTFTFKPLNLIMWIVIRSADLIDLWVICLWSFAHMVRRDQVNTDHTVQHRSYSENLWKVCLFCSQNNKIVWLSNMARHILRNVQGVQRFVGFFLFLDFAFHADWLSRWSHVTY